MRKIILYTMMLICQYAFGETIFQDGTFWINYVTGTHTPFPTPIIEKYTLEDAGDEFGTNTFIMYYENDREPNVKRIKTIIRRDGDKIYAMKSQREQEWLLLYDFGMKVGDVCKVWGICGIWDDPKAQEPISTYLKCISLSTENDKPYSKYGGEIMLMEEFLDEKCTERAGEGKWLRNLSSLKGITYNNYLQVEGGGTLLLEINVNGEQIYLDNTSGIETDDFEPFNVEINGKNVTVKGISENQTVELFSLDGCMVFSGNASSGNISLDVPENGIYILRTGNDATKICCK